MDALGTPFSNPFAHFAHLNIPNIFGVKKMYNGEYTINTFVVKMCSNVQIY